MSIIIMILLLGFLILVHEMGHFFAARALGIKVSKFALGFPIGPTLWSKKIGDVEYLIHACMIGGYVAFPDDDKDSELPMDSPERFINNPVWKRMIVISAGVVTNAVVAILLVWLTAGIWGQLPSGQAQIYVNNIVAEKGSSIYDSGMQKGDRIAFINGSKIESGYALSSYAQKSAAYDGKIDKDTLDDNLIKLKNLNKNLPDEGNISKGTVVTLPNNLTEQKLILSDDVLIGLAFYNDDRLKLDDKQIKLRDELKGKSEYLANGETTLNDLAYAISDNIRPLEIVVERNGKEIELNPIYPNEKGLIGIEFDTQAIAIKTNTPKKIIVEGSKYLWKQTTMQVYGFYQLLSGKIPAKEIHGIVAVAKVGGDVIDKGGLSSGLLLTAIISAWLAILNFLPIPALDGGHFMFLIIETLRGKPVSEKAIDILSTIFFVLIIILAFLLIGNDIYALIMHQL
ncbi:site-2 protease family protein [bacterium]|nr:site-2 protease family protein [bacterium]